MNRYALDVVHDDDYTLLEFLTHWTDPARSWAVRLEELFALHNTHRIVYDRLVALGSYYCLGRVDFRLFIGLGNVALAGIGWQFWRGYRQMAWPVWYFLPLPCWLFSLQSHENMFWGMAALQNFTVIWLILETLHQLHRRVWPGWPLLLSVAATLTSGNGLLAFPVGAVLLATQPGRGRVLIGWLVGTALAVGLMLGLSPVSEPRSPPVTWLPNTFLLLGAAFTNMQTTSLPMLGGAILGGALGLFSLGWLIQRGQPAQRLRQARPVPEWLAFGLVVLATAGLLAIHRTPAELLRDRYKIYAHLALSVVYLLALVVVSPRWRGHCAVGAIVLAGVMYAEAYRACLPRVIAGFQDRQADAANFRQYGTTLAPLYWRQANDSLLGRVQQQGIYRFPDTFGPPARWQTAPPSDSLTISTFVDEAAGNVFIGRLPQFIQVRDQHLIRQLADGTDCGVYLVVESSDKRRFILPAPPAESGVRQWLKGSGLFRPGFVTTFLRSRLEPGRYQIKVLRTTAGRHTLLDSGQMLFVPPLANNR